MSLNTKWERSKTREMQQEVENQQPDAYKSPYREKIDDTLSALGSAPDVSDTLGEALNQYRQRITENAQGAMQNAVAGNSALSGGYGNGYAATAARQGYDQSTADLGLAQNSLRAQALDEYQNQQNGLVEMLNALQNQDSIERGEAAGNLADWQQWRNYWQNRAQTARQNDQTDTQLDKVDAQYDKTQKENFWNNVWNAVTGVGSALQKGYDSYMGYTQQRENARMNAIAQAAELKKNGFDDAAASLLEPWGLDSSIFDNYTGEPLTLERQSELYNVALSLYAAGLPDAGKKLLDDAGMDSSVFNSYTGKPLTTQEKISYILSASSLAGSGDDAGKDSILNLLGLAPNTVDNYSTISNRQLSTALQKSAATKSGSSSGSSGRASGSSGSSSSGKFLIKGKEYSTSQILEMGKEFANMEETDSRYPFYKEVLTEAGMLDDGASSSGGDTGSSTDDGVDMAYMLAKNYAKKGYSSWAIMNNMHANGYSDDEIARALEKAGVRN